LRLWPDTASVASIEWLLEGKAGWHAFEELFQYGAVRSKDNRGKSAQFAEMEAASNLTRPLGRVFRAHGKRVSESAMSARRFQG